MIMEEQEGGPDTRVFMYRLAGDGSVEARIFASPDDVPAGEGWADSPARVRPVQADAPAAASDATDGAPDAPGGDTAGDSTGAPPRRRGRPPKSP
jgi:hypothetical protein